jgi:thiol:disulfide interchange protein
MNRAPFAIALVVVTAVLVPEPAGSRGESDAPGESWRGSESVAFADARVSKRHVVVVFGADWCVPCRKINEIMNDDAVFNLLSESFVPLHFDLSELSDRDEALQAKYRVPTLPAVIFIDAEERELGRWNTKDLSTAGFIAAMRSIVTSYPLGSGVSQ